MDDDIMKLRKEGQNMNKNDFKRLLLRKRVFNDENNVNFNNHLDGVKDENKGQSKFRKMFDMKKEKIKLQLDNIQDNDH
jgi:hypothetical protein